MKVFSAVLFLTPVNNFIKKVPIYPVFANY